MILFADNFRAYTSATQMLDGAWAGFDDYSTGFTTIANDPDPLVGSNGKALKCTNGTITPAGARFALPGGPTQKVGMAFRLWTTQLPSGNWGSWQGPLVAFRTAGNTNIVNMCVLSNGSIGVAQTNQNGTPYGATAAPVIGANAWNHIEIAVERSSTVGKITLYVNGVQKLALTGLNLGTDDIGQVMLGVNNWNFNNLSRGTTYYKDVVFWDGNGSSNNDFLGDVSVLTLKPTSDSTLNWTPSTGTTGWNLIDDIPANDTDYISTATTGDNVFNLEDLPPEYVGVKALIPVIRMNKNDGGTAKVQVGLLSNGDEDTGADRPVTSAPTFWYDVSEQNPDTASAWTPTSVNAAQLRINRTL